jgi:Na+-translocating ferredoxin:NAD+ oxidoreductase RnfD subunit
MNRAVRRFFRTPKGILILLLAALIIVAAFGEGVAQLWRGLAAAVLVAAAVDVSILRWRRRRWEVPSGALLTGMLVAMVMSPHEPWYVGAVVSAFAIVMKYVVRTRSANVFNPAALALVLAFYLFHAGHSWWGALPELPLYASMPALFITGVFITDRVNKLPLVIAFLGVYYSLFTLSAFIGDPTRVAEAFITPDLQAVLFFAFFILTDPPTSPTRYRDQVVCGTLVAVVSYGTFELLGVVYYLLAGVLAGNVQEAWRRAHHTRRARRPAAA